MPTITHRNSLDVNTLRNVSGHNYIPACNLYGMDWKDTIKARLRKIHMSQESLGERLGVSQGAVNHWLSGRRNPDFIDVRRMAEEVGLSISDLDVNVIFTPPTPASVSPGPDVRGHVPLISWVQAGSWNHAEDPLQPGDADEWLPCPASHGRRSYALRVRGDSMTSPHGKTYPEGCIIFVDPDQKSPPNGARIIAKLSGSDEVTFKVLVMDAGRTWLKPLNPQHPPILEEFRVLGTVIGKWEDE